MALAIMAPGTSVNQLIRHYLAQFGGTSEPAVDIEEFKRLSRIGGGDSRDEVHEGR